MKTKLKTWLRSVKKRTMAKTEDVLVVVLCGNRYAHASLLQMGTELAVWSALDSHRWTATMVPVTATPQELARNTACGLALERLKRPHDTLLMIDNDMIQRGWTSLKILATPDYDIAGGLQYMWLPADYEQQRPPQARPCAFMKQDPSKPGQQVIYPEPGERMRTIDRVGSGFMAIKRHVLDNPEMHLARGLDPPALWRNVYQPNYIRERGLDMDFCDRARELGYRIIVNWEAEIGHDKYVDVNEIDMYAKEQFALGYALGERNGLQMAAGRSDADEGADRGSGRGVNGDAGVAEAGLDRAARAAPATAAAQPADGA